MLIDYKVDPDLFDWAVGLFGRQKVNEALAQAEIRGADQAFDFFVGKRMLKHARIIHILFL